MGTIFGWIAFASCAAIVAALWHQANRRWREAEKALRGREDYFRSLIENASDTILVSDVNGIIRFASPSVEQFVGYPAAAVVGRNGFEFIHPDDRHRVMSYFQAGIQQPGSRHQSEFRFHHRDGSYHTVEAIAVYHVGTSELNGIIINCHDITERKNAALGMERARDLALETARMKSEFVANMSHEIRTPMNAIIGMTEILAETQLSIEQRRYLSVVHSAGETLLQIVNDILDFSKLEAGKFVLEKIDVDLRQLIDNVMQMLAARAQDKHIELLSWVSPGVPPQIKGDPGRLRQVLINLVGNAIKFTDRGHILMTAHRQDLDGHSWLRIAVNDTGIGIPEDGLRRLFQAFTQADGSTTRKFGGTGLGLMISKRIVEWMGGSIHVESRPGAGSVFWALVPWLPTVENAPAASPPADWKGRTIGVVEPYLPARAIMCRLLESWGLRCEAAATLQAALAQAVQAGHSVAALLIHRRSINAALPDIPMIALAEWGAPEEPETAQNQRFVACLTKPIKPSDLFDALSCALKPTAEPLPIAPPAPDIVRTLSSFASANILVAEDNLANQEILRFQLDKWGVAADFVGNGKQALDAFERKSYDLILMDCQMPHPDGYETTREIRKREARSPARGHTAIIAMTASAMEGDRENCLKAGMDDYVSKPVKASDLQAVMGQWLVHRTPTVAVPNKEADAADDLWGPLLSATEGDAAAMHHLMSIYLKHLEADIIQLRYGIEKNETLQVERLAHGLAGSSAAYGAAKLATLFKAVERFGRQGELRTALPTLKQIEREHDRVKSSAAIFLSKTAAQKPAA